MKTKKIPISFSPDNQKSNARLIDLMGITGVYGDIPKAVKYSINFAISAAENPEKVILQNLIDLERMAEKLKLPIFYIKNWQVSQMGIEHDTGKGWECHIIIFDNIQYWHYNKLKSK